MRELHFKILHGPPMEYTPSQKSYVGSTVETLLSTEAEMYFVLVLSGFESFHTCRRIFTNLQAAFHCPLSLLRVPRYSDHHHLKNKLKFYSNISLKLNNIISYLSLFKRWCDKAFSRSSIFFTKSLLYQITCNNDSQAAMHFL